MGVHFWVFSAGRVVQSVLYIHSLEPSQTIIDYSHSVSYESLHMMLV